MAPHIRPSTEADVAAITASTPTTSTRAQLPTNSKPPTPEEMSTRRSKILGLGLPYLVAEQDQEILGYAYAGQYRPRPATNTPSKIPSHRPRVLGHGLGQALLTALIEPANKGLGDK